MTTFLQWWADHWPLVPVLALYPIWGWEIIARWNLFREQLRERRREP